MAKKDKRVAQNFSALVQQFMMGRGYVPLTAQELAQRLSIPEVHERLFQGVLADLVSHQIIKKEGTRYRLPGAGGPEVVTALIRIHHRGFGFAQPEAPSAYPEIFIPKHLTANAVDGDTVEISVNKESYSDKGPEGRVIAVVRRGRTHIAGTVRLITHKGLALVYAPILGSAQLARLEETEEYQPKVGDRLIMKVKHWGGKEEDTLCEYSHYLGHISDPSCDVAAAIEEFGLRSDFPIRAQEEAIGLGSRVATKDLKGREDLRELETFTIDPDTAKDYDDALSLSKDANGHYHLGVHIADVTHYVPPGSALDEEAQKRCNSTYFPGRCVPMLPPELSNNLCSLKPNVNRLTVSVLMELDPQGCLVQSHMTRSVIRSRKRFTYREAKAVLDGEKKSGHSETLSLMVELCYLLKKRRQERGSVEFALPEVAVLVDESGAPTGLDRVEYDITHQLVEEFMLKANEVVAQSLNKQGKTLTYRVHEEPAADNIGEFVQLVGTFGFHLPDQPTGFDIQRFFDEAKGSEAYDYLATCYIRCMKLACYSPENTGHFGLSLEHYCHFTSPIRRYADVVVHRVLGGHALDKETLHRISDKCSEQERLSARAENSVKLLKKLRLLQAKIKTAPRAQFPAVVTRVKPFGIAFELPEYMTEGFLHVSELQEDFYEFCDATSSLVGHYTDRRFVCGDQLLVMVKEIDLITLEATWHLAHHAQRHPSKERAKRPPKKMRLRRKGKR